MSPKVRALLTALALISGVISGVPGSAGPVSARPANVSPAEGAPFVYTRAAQPMPSALPGERVLLKLEGQGKTLALTRRQLLALPTVRYATTHAQLNRTFTYEGVPLRDLARLGGFAGQDMRLYASNGYVTTIRARDYLQAPIMLAHTADGRPIPVLEKGPLTVVLPPDPQRFPARLYGATWVWFVARITAAP